MWPRMIWIGGTQGAGKSTIASSLALEHDLPLHPLDLYSYDHAQRMGRGQSLAVELSRGTTYAADMFEATSRKRLELAMADIAARGLKDVPVVVEGPQLSPRHLVDRPGVCAVWLLADAVRTRRVREQRQAAVDDPSTRGWLDALTLRDDLLTRRTRQAIAETGRSAIDVPVEPDWPGVLAAVASVLAVALGTAPRLNAGPELSGQRRLENLAACRQGRLWKSANGLAELPPFPFACECGRRRCSATWKGTPDQYDCAASEGPVRAAVHS